MKNMTIDNMVKACEGTLYYEKREIQEKEATAVVIDSRLVRKGAVFIAVKGERADGHSFISQVFEKEAMAVICEELPEQPIGPCILVKDSLKALKNLAKFYRSTWTIPVVGITGSVGKTSTKEFISGVLSAKYSVGKTQGNFNNEIGLPLTVLEIREEHQVAVLEMGISNFGEMHRLSEIAKPDICVLTNIGECHLENLGDRDGVLKAKTEIFDFMNRDGFICANGDDDKLSSLRKQWKDKLITFGRDESNDVRACKEKVRGLRGSICDIEGRVHLTDLVISLPGEHMVLNALAATSVANLLGLTKEEIKTGISKVEAVSGRSNIIMLKDMLLIDDCYNANPVSMKSAIDLLCKAEGRKIAVLGDMFELGEKEKELHYEVGVYAADRVDCLICVGRLASYIYEGAKNNRIKDMELIYIEEKEAVYSAIEKIKKPQDTFLIKASHGMGFAEIVAWMEKQ